MKLTARITAPELQKRAQQYLDAVGVSQSAMVQVALAAFLPPVRPEMEKPAPEPEKPAPKARKPRKPRQPAAKFVAPEFSEVVTYCESIGEPAMASVFWDEMQKSDWHYGKNNSKKLKCWRSHVNAFVRREKAGAKRSQSFRGEGLQAGNFEGAQQF